MDRLSVRGKRFDMKLNQEGNGDIKFATYNIPIVQYRTSGGVEMFRGID